MKKTAKKKKKTIKVKRKMVQYKKKKAKKKVVNKKTKKKVAKKKTTKKVVERKKVTKKKAVKKKVVRKKRRKKRLTRAKLLMTDIYPILNRVQIKGRTEVFVSEMEEADTIENTLKDLELRYLRRDMKRQVEFTVRPNKNNQLNNEEDLLDIEYLDDEIPEPGQIFP